MAEAAGAVEKGAAEAKAKGVARLRERERVVPETRGETREEVCEREAAVRGTRENSKEVRAAYMPQESDFTPRPLNASTFCGVGAFVRDEPRPSWPESARPQV